MRVRLIAEVGSSHLGDLDRMFKLIDACKEAGIDAVKFQLFPNDRKYTDCGNIWLDPVLFRSAFLYGKAIGMPVSASVFDEESFTFLLKLKPEFIKFSYSRQNQVEWIDTALGHAIEAIVSCDIMTDKKVPKKATKLYCIPEYPVRYITHFADLFKSTNYLDKLNLNARFSGFSDHTLGTDQTKAAIYYGAKIVEKHVKLSADDFNCPDDQFAVTIEEFGKVRG